MPPQPSPLHQLPGDIEEFTGRVAELNAMLETLDRDSGGAAAVTALAGMGGIGKTTLAVHAAVRLLHRFPDAQIVVNLNGHGDGAPLSPIAAMQQVVCAFYPELPPMESLAEAMAHYRTALRGKRALILLDNAADTDQIRPLIPPAPCGVIITSRTTVHPSGVRHIPLGLLSPDEAVRLLRLLAGSVEAAGAEWDRLAELCGHLPLALHVAGATLATAGDLTVAEYMQELADERRRPFRLRLDGSASDDVAAVLSHSVWRLVESEPALAADWQRLCVFPGDFDRDAALAVCKERGDDPAFLRSLRGRSLLLQLNSRRYRLHDLMRELARRAFEEHTELDPSPGSEKRLSDAMERFTRYFLTLIANTKTIINGENDNISTITSLLMEVKDIFEYSADEVGNLIDYVSSEDKFGNCRIYDCDNVMDKFQLLFSDILGRIDKINRKIAIEFADYSESFINDDGSDFIKNIKDLLQKHPLDPCEIPKLFKLIGNLSIGFAGSTGRYLIDKYRKSTEAISSSSDMIFTELENIFTALGNCGLKPNIEDTLEAFRNFKISITNQMENICNSQDIFNEYAEGSRFITSD